VITSHARRSAASKLQSGPTPHQPGQVGRLEAQGELLRPKPHFGIPVQAFLGLRHAAATRFSTSAVHAIGVGIPCPLLLGPDPAAVSVSPGGRVRSSSPGGWAYRSRTRGGRVRRMPCTLRRNPQRSRPAAGSCPSAPGWEAMECFRRRRRSAPGSESARRYGGLARTCPWLAGCRGQSAQGSLRFADPSHESTEL
jgi:hypothetical protein